MRRFTASVAMGVSLASGGCTGITAYSQQQFALQQDVETCSLYGASFRSAVYADCMRVHAERRDAATARQSDLIAQGTAAISGRR